MQREVMILAYGLIEENKNLSWSEALTQAWAIVKGESTIEELKEDTVYQDGNEYYLFKSKVCTTVKIINESSLSVKTAYTTARMLNIIRVCKPLCSLSLFLKALELRASLVASYTKLGLEYPLSHYIELASNQKSNTTFSYEPIKRDFYYKEQRVC